MDTDDPEFKEWAAKKLAEILSLEEKERLAEGSPPAELKEIYYILDSEVAPILDASGVQITREELAKIFTEWFVRREAAGAQQSPGGPPPSAENGAAPAASDRSSFARLSVRPGWRRLGVQMRRGLRFVGVFIMLLPLVLVPAYFFVSTQVPPPLAGGVMTLSPAVPMIAPGQTQNYSALTVTQPASAVTTTTLTAFSPEGLSFEVPSSFSPAQQTFTIPVSIRASALLAPGNYSVTVEEKEGSAVRNQTFKVAVVPAFVVMEHFSFVPQRVNVTKGTTVYWMNLDSTTGCCDPGYHDVYFQGGGMNVTSPVLVRLNTWSFKFDVPGQFYYYCSIHPYMAGSIFVAP